MVVVDQRERLTERYTKIKSMVEENDLRRLPAALLDFARNFGGERREIESEAIVLSGNLKRALKKERSQTESSDKVDVSRNRVLHSMLDLASQIYDGGKDKPRFVGLQVPEYLHQRMGDSLSQEGLPRSPSTASEKDAIVDPKVERAQAEAEAAKAKALEEQQAAERKIKEAREAVAKAKAECEAEEERAREAKKAAIANTIAAREEKKAARERIEQARAKAEKAEAKAREDLKKWEKRAAKASTQ